MTIDQQLLNTYFSGPWRAGHRGIAQFELSGFSLINKLNEGEKVIDVGCGMNHFKDKWPDVTGIDPAFPEADYQLSIEEYASQYTDKYDVAFCLGSLNFGTPNDIETQIRAVTQLLKPKARIYWRCNPGLRDHDNKECNTVPFYNWSFLEQMRLADLFGFKIKDLRWDSHSNVYQSYQIQNGKASSIINRIYAEWVRG